MANNIIGLLESLRTIESMIHTNTSASSTERGTIEGALGLEDLHASATRLQQRIKRSVQLLTGKDRATAEAVKNALKDAHLAKVYKCKAIQLRLANRVRNSLLAAVPFKRRISRVKKGECVQQGILASHEHFSLLLKILESSSWQTQAWRSASPA